MIFLVFEFCAQLVLRPVNVLLQLFLHSLFFSYKKQNVVAVPQIDISSSSTLCGLANCMALKWGPCGFKDSGTCRHSFLSPGYHKVILLPSRRKRREEEEEDRERGEEKRTCWERKCQTVWPFLGNPTTRSV